MRTFRYDKLVRDGVVPSMEAEGCEVQARQLSGAEALGALRDKVIEELQEVDTNKLAAGDDRAIRELADARAAFIALREAVNVNESDLERVQQSKADTMGAFATFTYVEAVSVPDDSPFIAHYLAEPERYPEVTDQPRD